MGGVLLIKLVADLVVVLSHSLDMVVVPGMVATEGTQQEVLVVVEQATVRSPISTRLVLVVVP
jgi:ABC-type proline/glycine betaine transport system permease subunit